MYPRVRTLFAFYRIPWGRNWKLYGTPIVQRHRNSIVKIGDGLQLRSSITSNPLGPYRPCILCTWQAGAVLEIGINLAMTGGALVAAERITIGDNVAIGANTTIIDTDFHALEPQMRKVRPHDARTAPVVIEDDVFIGMNALILKGVTLCRGCVIGAGSVVTRNVPSMCIAAGNPAKIIGTLSSGHSHDPSHQLEVASGIKPHQD